MIYRVHPALNIFKDIKANSQEEAIIKVDKEIATLIDYKKLNKKNYNILKDDNLEYQESHTTFITKDNDNA